MTQSPSAPPPAAPLPQARPVSGPRLLKEVRKHRRFASLRAIGALVLREMQTSHGRQSGGYFWAIAEPAGGIVLLTIIFSLAFREPPIGTSFPLFYATGMVPFLGYLDMSGKVAGAVRYSAALLAYPAVTFMDALLARIAFNSMTQIMVATVIFVTIFVTGDTRTDPQIDLIALSIAMMLVTASGVGAMNCFMFAAFSWWQPLWSILMRPFFLLSCIFFMFDDVPQPYQDWLWWNPLIHIIGQMRGAFYPGYGGDYVSHAYVFGLGLALFALGLALLARYHRDLQNS
ncbi:sugar ABC transporter permease [Paracoccus liaowanqingii]|uniref:Sugar ABC transporter permease n=1 Tax=Paracoccus liaowanqingii TaxID=2560053 RepID=A0A4P7HJ66_9RHOB|nr:ABC transporter permease [Paracoccus liaowanqingii]QBX34105.1 sugar ABC transporter permease [Paracoccus liaowanqingii]TGN48785.1 sugar ABC transporter permease [Paracoccus liaowanqingii]